MQKLRFTLILPQAYLGLSKNLLSHCISAIIIPVLTSFTGYDTIYNRVQNNNRPMQSIGLFIDYMHTPFHTAIISGISEAANSYNTQLWCFEFPVHRNEAQKIKPVTFFDFISKRNLDGLIIAPGILEPLLCTEHFYSFLKQQFTIPLVFLLSPVNMIPYIRVDNKGGMNKLLFHLFAEHGYRRPAFIKGNEQNSDFNIRYKTFTTLCDEYGIYPENNHICEGNYTFDSGRSAIKRLIDNKKLHCDVIIAANDQMAAGAMFELQINGIKIPEDIRITGFDDLETARFMNPPLTTIRQPLYDMGYKALEYTCELIKGNNVQQSTIMPAELIIRDSCGCMKSAGESKGKDIYHQKKERASRQNNNTREPYIILYEKQDLITYYDENLDKILKYIGQHYTDSELTIKKVELATGISSLRIAKTIKEKFNIHFKMLLNKIRCTEAKRLLENTDRYITDIAFQVGYNSRNHFYKAFMKIEGISPKEFRYPG
ncbi:MAG: substrate-binding domain-containing protein [Spirochaetales bacterium]|nr:substrate-binding domain-containing protein [Spirochaetales bacterium]